MGTLNPDLISKDMDAVMNDAVALKDQYKKPSLMPELVLLALLRSKDTAAARLLDIFKNSRGVDLERLNAVIKSRRFGIRAADSRLIDFVLLDSRVQLDEFLAQHAANGSIGGQRVESITERGRQIRYPLHAVSDPINGSGRLNVVAQSVNPGGKRRRHDEVRIRRA